MWRLWEYVRITDFFAELPVCAVRDGEGQMSGWWEGGCTPAPESAFSGREPPPRRKRQRPHRRYRVPLGFLVPGEEEEYSHGTGAARQESADFLFSSR